MIKGLETVRANCANCKLELNSTKCEVISANSSFSNQVSACLAGCRILEPSASELLGAPLGQTAANASLIKKKASLHDVRPRLAAIDRHDALAILRISLGHHKAIYTLRAGPSFDSSELSKYDDELGECAWDCLNVHFDDIRWKQASLHPFRGGLGIRSTTSLAHSSFLSACESVSVIAGSLSGGAPDIDKPRALAQWRDLTRGASIP